MNRIRFAQVPPADPMAGGGMPPADPTGGMGGMPPMGMDPMGMGGMGAPPTLPTAMPGATEQRARTCWPPPATTA